MRLEKLKLCSAEPSGLERNNLHFVVVCVFEFLEGGILRICDFGVRGSADSEQDALADVDPRG